MIMSGFRFRVGLSLMLGLIWTSAALGDPPLLRCGQDDAVPQDDPASARDSSTDWRPPIDQEAIDRLIADVRPRSGGEVLLVECTGSFGYATIQAAIDAAEDGDLVVVLPNYCNPAGRHYENISFLGKAITVQSTNPLDPEIVAATIIDGNQNGSVVTFNNEEGSDAALDGITITNGLADDGGGIHCLSASPAITNCTITGNTATGSGGSSHGGGVYCDDNSDPTIANCTIVGNTAGSNGGGVYCDHYSNPTITDSTVDGNTASTGGGIYCHDHSSPLITNCTVTANQASGFGGGGIFCSDYSSASITNCAITGNTAAGGGGGVRCYNSNPAMTNCTITWNRAIYLSGWGGSGNGGGIDCSGYGGSEPVITNSILWHNAASSSGNEIYVGDGSPAVTFSCIEGGWGDIGNIDADPLFLDPGHWDDGGTPEDPTDDVWIDGDYHLSATSPCINIGDDSAVPAEITTDMDGDDRISQCRVDMGIDETPHAGLAECNENGTADACDIDEGDSTDCNENGVPDECEPGGLEDCNNNGVSDLCDIHGGPSRDCNANAVPDDCEVMPVGVLYVDGSATGGLNDGSSWDNAYTHPSDATNHAACSQGEITEVRIAQGTYVPDTSGLLLDDREATFQLVSGVAIYGGYAGLANPCDPDARDIELYQTILSGDLNGDDDAGGDNSENSYCVVTGSYTDETTILDGVVITASNGNGGLYIWEGNPTIRNCTISGNAGSGGGVYCFRSNVTITGCTITQNEGEFGGGLSIRQDSYLLITNCLIADNAAFWGGGVHCTSSDPTITNCTISGNSAQSYGGGVYCYRSDPILSNCILWLNKSYSSLNQVYVDNYSNPVVTYSCIQHGWPGVGNIDEDPLFLRTPNAGLDRVFQTEDDDPGDLRLRCDSPCLDIGDNDAVPQGITTDLLGNPRIIDGIVDMGPYEGPYQAIVLDTNDLLVPEGDTVDVGVTLACDPDGPAMVNVFHHSGDEDIGIVSSATLAFDSSNYWIPQPVILGAGEDCDSANGGAIIQLALEQTIIQFVYAHEVENDQALIYVDATAEGDADGSSWADAFPDLQAALAGADAMDDIVREIRLAGGTYTPAVDSDRSATFQLISGVAVYGGYAGVGSPNPDERNIELYQTILSGDLNGDDADGGNNSDNCYHVVTGSETNPTALLDGVTITAGNADSPGSYDKRGGGIYISGGNPTITHCLITGNTAVDKGGGIYCVSYSSPAITYCTISNNSTDDDGGGICCSGSSSPSIIDCTISENTASSGGGVYCYGSSPSFINCTISENAAAIGGGLSCRERSSPMIASTTISNNTADSYGGGVYCRGDTSPFITNCVIAENSAGRYGGGMYFTSGCSPRITNCTIGENVVNMEMSTAGGGIYCSSRCTLTLIGCLIDANEAIGTSGTHGGGIGIGSQSDATIADCMILGNTVTGSGGGISSPSSTSSMMITNCLISGNAASGSYYSYGGGLSYSYGSLTATNCTVTGNSAVRGGGFHLYTDPELTNCTFAGNTASDKGGGIYGYSSGVFTNCIFWDNFAPDDPQVSSWAAILYSTFQGGHSGTGNIDADPLFADPGHWDDNGTPENPDDDIWIDGDYHLLPASPCIDAGDPDFVPGPGETDIDGQPRVMGCGVDMGADEFETGEPDSGDFDGSGGIDLDDLPLLVQMLLNPTSLGDCIGDLSGDGELNGGDIQTFVEELLSGP